MIQSAFIIYKQEDQHNDNAHRDIVGTLSLNPTLKSLILSVSALLGSAHEVLRHGPELLLQGAIVGECQRSGQLGDGLEVLASHALQLRSSGHVELKCTLEKRQIDLRTQMWIRKR